jgi:hypothetical protein
MLMNGELRGTGVKESAVKMVMGCCGGGEHRH